MRARALWKAVSIVVVFAGLCPADAAVCPADCDGDGMVSVSDLARSASIALGNTPVGACSSADLQHDGTVSIGDLIGAVNTASVGCVNPLQGSEGLEASARLAVSTSDSIQDFGFIGVFFGAAQAGSGAAGTSCTLGGSKDVSCDAGLPSVQTTVYSDCSDPGSTATTTVTRTGTVVQTVTDPNVCTSGQIPDDVDVTSAFTAYSQVFADAGEVTKTLKANALTLQRHPLDPSGQQITANGKLSVDSPKTKERFTQTFTGFRLTTTPQSDGSVLVTLDGAMNVDCLGALQFRTNQPIRFRAAAACPSAGEFEVAQPLTQLASDGAASADRDLLGARAAGEAANATAAGFGLQQSLFRAGNGQVYQVLQNVGGEPDTGGDDIRVTTLVGTLGAAGSCAETSPGSGSEAVAAALFGEQLPLAAGFKSARMADASPPCFYPNGAGGAGRLCFGPGCTSDCVCLADDGCKAFTIGDGTAIATAADIPAASAVDQLSISGSFCSGFTGRSTYRFGAAGPSTRAGECGAEPADGFLLPNGASAFTGGQRGSTVVFAYDVPLASRFTAGAAGFSIDRNGKNALGCTGTNTVLIGRSSLDSVLAPRVTFTQDEGVNFDFDPRAPSIDRSLPSCDIPLLAACAAFPTPTPTPQPANCPETDLGGAPSASASGSTVGKPNMFGGATCGDGGDGAPEATFGYTAPTAGVYQVRVLGTFESRILYVRDGFCNGPELACGFGLGLCDLSFPPSCPPTQVLVTLRAGQHIAVIVDNFAGDSGPFDLDIRRLDATPTPLSTPTPPTGLPDLVITGVTAPASGTLGTQISVSATVTNQGSRSAGAFQASFVLSRDADLSATDIVLASCSYSELAAGATVPCNGTILLPGTLPTGTYFFGAIADVFGQVAESNDGNNTRAVSGGIVLNGLPGTPTPLPACPLFDLGSPPNLSLTTLSTIGRPSSLAGASCGGGGGQAADFSFAYTAPQSGTYSIDTIGSSFDTVLYVRSSCGGTELACNDDLSFGSRESQVVLQLAAGQKIIIVVDGFGVANGSFALNINSGSVLPTNTPSGPQPTPTPQPTVDPNAPVVRIGSVSGAPGQRVSIDVTIDPRGQAISDISHALNFDQRTAIPIVGELFDCVVNPAINKSDTAFFPIDVGVMGVDVTSFSNASPIPTGRLYTCPIDIAADAPAGVYPLQCTDLFLTRVDGADVEGACVDGAVTVSGG